LNIIGSRASGILQDKLQGEKKMDTKYQLINRGVLISTHRSCRAAEKALKKNKGNGILKEIIDGKVTEIGISHGSDGDVEWRQAE
jgi:hypothetical protein